MSSSRLDIILCLWLLSASYALAQGGCLEYNLRVYSLQLNIPEELKLNEQIQVFLVNEDSAFFHHESASISDNRSTSKTPIQFFLNTARNNERLGFTSYSKCGASNLLLVNTPDRLLDST